MEICTSAALKSVVASSARRGADQSRPELIGGVNHQSQAHQQLGDTLQVEQLGHVIEHHVERPEVVLDEGTLLYVEPDLPCMVEQDLHGRDGQHVERVDEDHLHQAPARQAGHRLQDHPEYPQCRQAGKEHADGADNEVRPILHAGLDVLCLDDEIQAEVFGQAQHAHPPLMRSTFTAW
jgi:hypothetical protein